jgi:hypothetical protein
MLNREHQRTYRVVSLDTSEHDEPDFAQRSLDRLMRGIPTPRKECENVVRTTNGNLVQAVSR